MTGFLFGVGIFLTIFVTLPILFFTVLGKANEKK